jgi:hypothetical protein
VDRLKAACNARAHASQIAELLNSTTTLAALVAPNAQDAHRDWYRALRVAKRMVIELEKATGETMSAAVVIRPTD